MVVMVHAVLATAVAAAVLAMMVDMGLVGAVVSATSTSNGVVAGRAAVI